ncbi:MAG: UbiA family prenyltransferase [Deltaproteobacteria bacterium]|nr:UbiA family prenyltransferase [Deltaproteobacteria bacterium]
MIKRLGIKLIYTLEMIRFSHSIFALPFALAALVFAADGLPPLKTVGLIILAMITARNTAMAFNRFADAKIDAKNPRTANRHIPRGSLSRGFVLGFAIINGALFIWIAGLFNPLAFKLSPVALAIIYFYSYTKRFTHFTQLFLGLSLAIAPIGAWIALRGTVELFPILLGLAVMFWVAGFDIFYATQDYHFDKSEGLKSLVVRLGIANALITAKFFHILSMTFFLTIGIVYHLNLFYLTTVMLMGTFLAFEHHLVRPNDLSKVNTAFFTLNGMVGILYLAGTIVTVITAV